MRRLLFIFLFIPLYAKSQCISIELSVHWVKDFVPFFSDSSKICYPYLNITYRNNSDTALYFLNVSQENYGFPDVYMALLLNPRPTIKDAAINYTNYTNNTFNVLLGNSPTYLTTWDIIDIADSTEMSFVNYSIGNIYIYMKQIMDLDEKIIKVENSFLESDFTQERIISSPVKERFVFLKSGESYTSTFNLIGFQLVEGDFLFKIDPYIKNYVFLNPRYNEQESKYDLPTKHLLPKEVGEYSLYSGTVLTNEVKVSFKGNKAKHD